MLSNPERLYSLSAFAAQLPAGQRDESHDPELGLIYLNARYMDPASGATRTWYETLDAAGNVCQIRPQTSGAKVHYRFGRTANISGSGKMKITLDDIRQKFDVLASETESREEVADFAARDGSR